MSNTNNNLQTQTSNALRNPIMEACGKDRPPMLAPEGYMENYKNVLQDIRDQLNAEVEAVQIILIWIDNNITPLFILVQLHVTIERLKQCESINVQDLETNLYWEFGKFTSQDGESLESYYSRSQPAVTKNRGKAIVNSSPPTYDQEPSTVANDEMSKEKEIDNSWPSNQDNSPRINKGTGYDNQRVVNVAGARENVEHPEQPESVNKPYMVEQDEHYIIIDSLDMCYDREQDNQDDTNDLVKERNLLASLNEKLKCEIDDSKSRYKFLESSNKALVDKLK
nr:hypothetical protein [Tanacetum cinerariifolium]